MEFKAHLHHELMEHGPNVVWNRDYEKRKAKKDVRVKWREYTGYVYYFVIKTSYRSLKVFLGKN